jgi:hypothetical protein
MKGVISLIKLAGEICLASCKAAAKSTPLLRAYLIPHSKQATRMALFNSGVSVRVLALIVLDEMHLMKTKEK